MPKSQEQRTLKSLSKTSKYHLMYVGNILVLALALVGLLYLMLLNKVLEVTGDQAPEVVRDLVFSVTLGAFLVALTVTFVCLLAAHRISGVHIKLKNTFEKIKEGELDTRLVFRKEDRLDDVETAFNEMMDSLKARIPAGQAEPAE